MNPPADIRQRFAGLLLGTAVGDALGLPAEGLSPEKIKRRWRGQWRMRLIFGRGMISDDTEHQNTASAGIYSETNLKTICNLVSSGHLPWSTYKYYWESRWSFFCVASGRLPLAHVPKTRVCVPFGFDPIPRTLANKPETIEMVLPIVGPYDSACSCGLAPRSFHCSMLLFDEIASHNGLGLYHFLIFSHFLPH